jgi:ketopantoate reductase
VLWAKLAFISAQAGMTAAVRLPIGEIRTVKADWAAFLRLVAEACAVAEADGHPVPEAAQDRAVAMAQAIEPGSFSSLHDVSCRDGSACGHGASNWADPFLCRSQPGAGQWDAGRRGVRAGG